MKTGEGFVVDEGESMSSCSALKSLLPHCIDRLPNTIAPVPRTYLLTRLRLVVIHQSLARKSTFSIITPTMSAKINFYKILEYSPIDDISLI